MLDILTLPVGQLQSNCYLTVDAQTNEALIIDPGDDADFIIRTIVDKACHPKAIIATHGHFDHIMAVTELRLAYKIPFLIHKDDAFLVKNMRSSAQHFLNIIVDPPPHIDTFLNPKENIRFGTHVFQVLETPGHTPGSICLYSKADAILFTGDLLFADGGVGRTDFSYSNPSDLKKSLSKIFSFPGDTIIYPGHGRASTLGEERAILNHP